MDTKEFDQKRIYIIKALGKLILEMKEMGFEEYSGLWFALLSIFPPISDEELKKLSENFKGLIEELKEKQKRDNGLKGLN